jgi:hypothetical protein
MRTTRWFAVGQASGSDAELGRRAAGQTLVGSDPRLLIVFCSESLDLVEAVSQINRRSGGAPLIGCSTSGEIGTTVRTTRACWWPRSVVMAFLSARRSLEIPRATLELPPSSWRVACPAPTTRLSQGGLAQAMRVICNRSTIPVELDLKVDRRLPDPVEIAALYIVSEGLPHAVEQAPISTVRVGVELTDQDLRVDVHDDGVGGDGPRGSGLRDRVAALGGTITVVSPPGAGIAIIAEVPIDGR